MKINAKCLILKAAICLTYVFCISSSFAATIKEGEVRTAKGVVANIDEEYGSIVIESPFPSGDLTVGVTLQESVKPVKDGIRVGLSEILGKRALIKYTREDGRLVGLSLSVLE